MSACACNTCGGRRAQREQLQGPASPHAVHTGFFSPLRTGRVVFSKASLPAGSPHLERPMPLPCMLTSTHPFSELRCPHPTRTACSRLSVLPPLDPTTGGWVPQPPPDSHEPHQGPARVVDLRRGTLHVTPLLAGLEVFPPAPVHHLPGQQEVAGLGDRRTHTAAETSKTETLSLQGGPSPDHHWPELPGGMGRSTWVGGWVAGAACMPGPPNM